MRALRWSCIALVFPLAVVLAMAASAGKSKTNIASITADPGRLYNKEVAISGRVTDSFGAMGHGIYQVDDGTGRMWVLSGDHGLPNKGAKVQVTGRVVQTATFAGRSYAPVLRETQRGR